MAATRGLREGHCPDPAGGPQAIILEPVDGGRGLIELIRPGTSGRNNGIALLHSADRNLAPKARNNRRCPPAAKA